MKNLFHYLSLLNLFDAVVTHYGLKNGLITESNPFMDRAYQADPVLLCAWQRIGLTGESPEHTVVAEVYS